MLRTYRAILWGNNLEWNGDAPECLESEKAVEVQVTILKEAAIPSATIARGKGWPKLSKSLPLLMLSPRFPIHQRGSVSSVKTARCLIEMCDVD